MGGFGWSRSSLFSWMEFVASLARFLIFWVFLNWTLCCVVTNHQKVSKLAPISILASMLLGRVQMKKKCLFQTKNGIGMDMALSEYEFYTPKRFTVSSCLTITKVRFLGRKPSKIINPFFSSFLGPLEAKLTNKLHKTDKLGST